MTTECFWSQWYVIQHPSTFAEQQMLNKVATCWLLIQLLLNNNSVCILKMVDDEMLLWLCCESWCCAKKQFRKIWTGEALKKWNLFRGINYAATSSVGSQTRAKRRRINVQNVLCMDLMSLMHLETPGSVIIRQEMDIRRTITTQGKACHNAANTA